MFIYHVIGNMINDVGALFSATLHFVFVIIPGIPQHA